MESDSQRPRSCIALGSIWAHKREVWETAGGNTSCQRPTVGPRKLDRSASDGTSVKQQSPRASGSISHNHSTSVNTKCHKIARFCFTDRKAISFNNIIHSIRKLHRLMRTKELISLVPTTGGLSMVLVAFDSNTSALSKYLSSGTPSTVVLTVNWLCHWQERQHVVDVFVSEQTFGTTLVIYFGDWYHLSNSPYFNGIGIGDRCAEKNVLPHTYYHCWTLSHGSRSWMSSQSFVRVLVN
jgi:hypothetical protein